jgi:UDP-N-acetylmuramoyl-tripeptide--D-alanyl-D-alanine ligase
MTMQDAALWTADEAAAATGGSNSADWRANGVSIDSRTIARDDLFVALKGPSFDGHDYVGPALEGGAAAGLVSHPLARLPADAPLLMVDDTLDALTALGVAARGRTAARIVAVTGSAGKTGVKEALRHVLADQGETSASLSSFNNHWGVPLSLSRMPAAAEYGVFEIGMNHAGEISSLVRLVRPHVAIVTNVERAHTEFFPSIEAVADAKAEIFDSMAGGMSGGGTAVLNRDNPHFDRLARAAKTRGVAVVLSFGTDETADARLVRCVLDPLSSTVSAEICGREIDYRIAVPGHHWVMNSLAVLAAVYALGADVERAAAALDSLAPLDGRGRVHRLGPPGAGFTLIDESYNANPASVTAAIETLGRMSPGAGGRRVAVLGTMRELGDQSAALHAGLAGTLVENGIDLVHAAGQMGEAHRLLPASMRGALGENGDSIVDQVIGAVRAGDVVMVKGSNASRMNVVVAALLATAENFGAPAQPAQGERGSDAL